MKKSFIYAFASVALIAASAAFSACSETEEESGPAEKTVKEAELSAVLYVNQEMAEIFDIVGHTTTGQVVTLAATPKEVTFMGEKRQLYPLMATVRGKNVPLFISAGVTFSVKDGAQLPAKFNMVLMGGATGKLFYTDGTSETFQRFNYKQESTGVNSAYIDMVVANLNKNFAHISATLFEDGIQIGGNEE